MFLQQGMSFRQKRLWILRRCIPYGDADVLDSDDLNELDASFVLTTDEEYGAESQDFIEESLGLTPDSLDGDLNGTKMLTMQKKALHSRLKVMERLETRLLSTITLGPMKQVSMTLVFIPSTTTFTKLQTPKML